MVAVPTVASLRRLLLLVMAALLVAHVSVDATVLCLMMPVGVDRLDFVDHVAWPHRARAGLTARRTGQPRRRGTSGLSGMRHRCRCQRWTGRLPRSSLALGTSLTDRLRTCAQRSTSAKSEAHYSECMMARDVIDIHCVHAHVRVRLVFLTQHRHDQSPRARKGV